MSTESDGLEMWPPIHRLSDWHVYPTNDLIQHETTGDCCVCMPDAKLHEGEWILVHHSLDGRELSE